MPWGDFEREVMRTLAAGRNPDSFVAGGTVLHQAADSPRRSEDVDLFHDTVEAVQRAFDSDMATLQSAGFVAEAVGRAPPEFRPAIVRRAREKPEIESGQDSAFRRFPM